MRVPLIAALAATIALAGCGADDDSDPADDSSASLADVLTYFEPDSPTIYAADVDRARSELGLPEDADPTDLASLQELDTDDPLYPFLQGVSASLPGRDEFTATLEVPAVLEALDGTRINAAATDRRADREVSVIATDQPFDEIDEALDDPNYTLSDAGDGLILITVPDVDADALIADPPGGVPEADTMIGGDGASLVFLGDITGLDDCLLSTAITASADNATGTVGLTVDGVAEADRVDTEGIVGPNAALELGTPTVEGNVVRIPYTADVEPGAPSPGFQLYSQFLIYDLYRCES